MWVLGDVFLRKYYSIYDLDNQLIGLVRSKQEIESDLNT